MDAEVNAEAEEAAEMDVGMEVEPDAWVDAERDDWEMVVEIGADTEADADPEVHQEADAGGGIKVYGEVDVGISMDGEVEAEMDEGKDGIRLSNLTSSSIDKALRKKNLLERTMGRTHNHGLEL